jgi:hypothetical protein
MADVSIVGTCNMVFNTIFTGLNTIRTACVLIVISPFVTSLNRGLESTLWWFEGRDNYGVIIMTRLFNPPNPLPKQIGHGLV